jgi:hypothetical protein
VSGRSNPKVVSVIQDVARANVDHYLGLLTGGDLAPDKKSVVVELLTADVEKLRRDPEAVEFVESRVASGRERVSRAMEMLESFPMGTPERGRAKRSLVALEDAQALLEDLCLSPRGMTNTP